MCFAISYSVLFYVFGLCCWKTLLTMGVFICVSHTVQATSVFYVQWTLRISAALCEYSKNGSNLERQ